MRSATFVLVAAALAMTGNLTFAANEPAGAVVQDRPAAGTLDHPTVEPAPTPGNDAEAVFRAVGMFGNWAADCGRPASPDNPHVSVTSSSAGLIIENNDVGPEYAANRYSILAARRLSSIELEVKVLFRPGAAGEERQTLIFEMRKGTRRTLFNRVEGGEVRVKNGVTLSRGIKTPVLKKCG